MLCSWEFRALVSQHQHLYDHAPFIEMRWSHSLSKPLATAYYLTGIGFGASYCPVGWGDTSHIGLTRLRKNLLKGKQHIFYLQHIVIIEGISTIPEGIISGQRMLMLTRSCLFAVIWSKHYSKAQWPMQVEKICDGLRNNVNKRLISYCVHGLAYMSLILYISKVQSFSWQAIKTLRCEVSYQPLS